VRSRGGCVSGSARDVHASTASVNASSAQKIARQPIVFSRMPPMTGAIAGAIENTSVICDIAFCASGPWKLSRMIARPTTSPVPADNPWSARASHSDWMLPAIAQSSVAIAYTTSPAITTGRRPSASESAPCHSIMNA
jgi:hypothetical protein